jgi:hypothetical protein
MRDTCPTTAYTTRNSPFDGFRNTSRVLGVIRTELPSLAVVLEAVSALENYEPWILAYTDHQPPLASGFIHLQNEERLFDRLSALGGSPLIGSFPPEVAEIAFGMVTQALGLGSLPPAEQVKSLLEIPASELEAKLRDLPAPVGSVVDGDIVRAGTTFQALANVSELAKTFPGIRWIKKVLMGDCQFDVGKSNIR